MKTIMKMKMKMKKKREKTWCVDTSSFIPSAGRNLSISFSHALDLCVLVAQTPATAAKSPAAVLVSHCKQA
jgi:hypothetical protein